MAAPTVGFTDEKTEKVEPTKRARQIKNRATNRLQRRLALYTRSILITKDPVKLAVLKGKAEATTYALAVLNEV